MAKPAVKKNETPELPDAEEQARLLAGVRAFATEPRFALARRAMNALRPTPPQSLLLEGGSSAERANAALYWAALLNCPSVATVKASPCLACPLCLRYVSRLHRDLFFFDGGAESIKIDEVREMRSVLGEPPREGLLRLVVFAEAQALGEAAANALLKSLEEPKPGTVFVLTAPQRERLLPTLVSRSWTLTLPWPGGQGLGRQERPEEANQDLPILEWAGAMLDFAGGGQNGQSGRGWMERTARRGALDAALAMRLVLLCQACLLEALSGRNISKTTCSTMPELSVAFARLAPASLHILGEALAEAQDSLNYNVNPGLVLDWLATRLFFVFAGDAGR